MLCARGKSSLANPLQPVIPCSSSCHAPSFPQIPHEIADYSILIKSGSVSLIVQVSERAKADCFSLDDDTLRLTKRQAMGSQFITAVGAFVGTFLGIWIQSLSSASTSHLPDTPDLVGALLTSEWGFVPA